MNAEQLPMARAFAAYATSGWTKMALQAFCAQHNISAEQQRAWWPGGIRSVAWDMNAAADEEMERHWLHGAPTFAAIFEQCFKANESLRASVGHLAKSDLFHPFNTIARTAETVRRMQALRGLHTNAWRTGRLVAAYSAAVLVWVGDSSETGTRTARASAAFLALVGLR